MKMLSVVGLTAVACVLGACASYRPVVDSRSISNMAQYERDLSDCQRYAEQVEPGATAVIGAVVGAVLGAAVGAIADDPYWGVYAGIGAVSGLAGGANSGVRDQKDVIRTCMSHRGYAVLN